MEMHNKHIINKIDLEKKNVFRKKALFSFVIIFYMLISIFLCFFANTKWSETFLIPISSGSNSIYYIQSIFSFLFIFSLLPILVGVIYEINKLFFGIRNKVAFSSMLFVALLFLIAPNIVYIIFWYFLQSELNDHNLIFRWFVITIICSFIVLILINIFLIKTNHMNNLKQISCLLTITFFSIFGIFSIAFIGLLKGPIVILYFFMIASLFDTFAYISGMLFGKHKMAPITSPRKTWEGFGGGLILTILISCLVFYLFSFDDKTPTTQSEILHFNILEDVEPWKQWMYVIFLVIFLAITSQIGDLFYSYIKRMHNIKDYSKLLKEHGGFLDRFDSSLMVFSVYTIILFIVTAISDESLWPLIK